MKFVEAQKLAKRIPLDLPSVRVTGVRRYAPGDYAIDATETRNGVSFVVFSAEDWAERVTTAKFYAAN